LRVFRDDGRQGRHYRAGNVGKRHSVSALTASASFSGVDRGGVGHNCGGASLALQVFLE